MPSTFTHPAKAVMDLWRTTTPRLRLRVVRTIRQRDVNGNTEYRAYIGMVRVTAQRDYALTEAENHLAVALEALQQYRNCPWTLLDFDVVDEKNGTFVVEIGQ
jgi:hypothetical protein